MSTALTTPAATTGPEARERSGHDDGDTGARRRQRPRVLDRPGARAVVGLAAPAVLLVLWWAVTAAGLLSAVQLPSPGAVLSAGVNLLERGDLWLHVGISTQRVLLGFLLGAALGLAVGSALGLSRWADALFAPLIGALRAVPSLAWVPLLILWMQIGEESKVTLIAIGAFFPVFTTVYAALRHVDPHHEFGRTMLIDPESTTLYRLEDVNSEDEDVDANATFTEWNAVEAPEAPAKEDVFDLAELQELAG